MNIPPGRPWYALEKFEEAVYELAIGPGDARERMYHIKKIITGGTSREDIPEDIRGDYDWVFSRFGSKGPRPNRNTCGKMAERIVKMRDRLRLCMNENPDLQ